MTVKMDRCHNPKVLESEDISEMLCKLLKLHAAPDVDVELFNGNTLNYHYFMALFKEVVESKINDPRGRLTRLINYTTSDSKKLIKIHCHFSHCHYQKCRCRIHLLRCLQSNCHPILYHLATCILQQVLKIVVGSMLVVVVMVMVVVVFLCYIQDSGSSVLFVLQVS